MSLLDRISQVGNIRQVEVDGLIFHVKTKNVRQQAKFTDDLESVGDGDTEVKRLDLLIDILAEIILKIDGVKDVKDFLGKVPSMKDLMLIGASIGKELTEKESKNSCSPSESPISAAVVPKDAVQEPTSADSVVTK